MNRIYETNFDLDLDLIDESEMIEIRNPSGSGQNLSVIRIGVTSEAGFSEFMLKRYSSLATHNDPESINIFQWDPADPSPNVEIWVGEPDVDVVWPDVEDLDYEHKFQLDPSDAGDDDKLQTGQYLQPHEQVMIPPGCSASLTMPDGQAMYTIKIVIREEPVQPIEHIASGALPSAGAFTAASYFDIPHDWTGLTFCGSYTAHGSSTGARPKWRVMWSDGVRDYQQPIESSTIDTSGAPIALRDQYDVQDRITAIAANATKTFVVPTKRMPGMTKVRLDVAELGDTAHVGTIVVDIVGG